MRLRAAYVYLRRRPPASCRCASTALPDRPDRHGRHPGESSGSSPTRQASNHNGGTLAFGPDALLWLATGDGGGQTTSSATPQTSTATLGKLLRIDPRPGTPRTPFRREPFRHRGLVVGLRNPFRFSFDRGTATC